MFQVPSLHPQSSPGGSDDEESTCDAGDLGSDLPHVRKIPRREWQPIPVFLPGEFHGQRSLVGCSPWGHKGSDRTERLTFSYFFTSSPPCKSAAEGVELQVLLSHRTQGIKMLHQQESHSVVSSSLQPHGLYSGRT